MKRKAGSEARLECALSHSPGGGLALLLFNDRRDLLQVVYVARTFPGKSKEMSEIEDRPLRQTALVSTGSLTPLLWQGALSPKTGVILQPPSRAAATTSCRRMVFLPLVMATSLDRSVSKPMKRSEEETMRVKAGAEILLRSGSDRMRRLTTEIGRPGGFVGPALPTAVSPSAKSPDPKR